MPDPVKEWILKQMDDCLTGCEQKLPAESGPLFLIPSFSFQQVGIHLGTDDGDYGTARADFPGGDARTLWRSMQRLLSMPAATRLFMCHDYKAPGRDDYAWETTVGAERQNVNLAVTTFTS